MTNEELKQLIATLALSQQRTDFQMRETDGRIQETARLLQESKAEADRALRALTFQIGESGAETDRRLQETAQEVQQTAQENQRTAQGLQELQKETDRLSKQMGELGNKFGSFTEGMAFPSMSKLLKERFGADFVTLRAKKEKGGRTLEVDVLAVANSERNAAYVVEVKSHLKQEGVDQMLRILRDFPEFYPDQRDKQLYGILALVDTSDEVRQKVLDEGLYLAQISGDTFQLCVPEDFVPRSFQQPEA